ncbi:predicted protein [Nematostella vectensis]|uniref:Uncharacterized protein n=1 Tax=Nematostella vectensis TaxID=45351 RepID=A7SPP7_NEMVE|nr:predicted protein [Nematostella vectensis]|eukprot:XP_001626390.1 predicted protein [Nematostella vectensis]
MIETQNKIQAPKSGPEFLSASHFSISQEDRWGPGRDPKAYQSIFKKDYPPLPLTKRGRIPSPPPAGIMHKDDRYADHASLTRTHFVEKPLKKTQYSGSEYALRKTNFKMDSDTQLKSFDTTHKEYFPVRSLSNAQNPAGTGKTEWMKSSIPQGDKEKELWPQSDYKSRFLGEQLGRGSLVRVRGDQEGKDTITGDRRTQNGQFNTTTKSEFIGHYLPKQMQDPALKAGGSNIPQGDQEKCNYSTSTQQVSFRRPTISKFAPFNREEAVHKLRQTTFQLGDRRVPHHLQSTAAHSYPCPSHTDRSKAVNLSMGDSSFPQGDLDPMRSHERICRTTNDLFFGHPALGHRNPIVDGSNLRTVSNVHLGGAKGKRFYDTSMKSDYQAVPCTYKQPASGTTTNSSIPLDYYAGEVTLPTTWSDFPSHAGFPKLLPNPAALSNLKMSHIVPPIPGEREFSTTHQRTYTPKKTSRLDSKLGSLQRSSVPIGTLDRYQ